MVTHQQVTKNRMITDQKATQQEHAGKNDNSPGNNYTRMVTHQEVTSQEQEQ